MDRRESSYRGQGGEGSPHRKESEGDVHRREDKGSTGQRGARLCIQQWGKEALYKAVRNRALNKADPTFVDSSVHLWEEEGAVQLLKKRALVLVCILKSPYSLM